jgi:cation diffusion facilitator CzcD-associated flavoprotein CzcO
MEIFRAIRKGTASIVTDHIDRFLTDGILLKSGKALKILLLQQQD